MSEEGQQVPNGATLQWEEWAASLDWGATWLINTCLSEASGSCKWSLPCSDTMQTVETKHPVFMFFKNLQQITFTDMFPLSVGTKPGFSFQEQNSWEPARLGVLHRVTLFTTLGWRQNIYHMFQALFCSTWHQICYQWFSTVFVLDVQHLRCSTRHPWSMQLSTGEGIWVLPQDLCMAAPSARTAPPLHCCIQDKLPLLCLLHMFTQALW